MITTTAAVQPVTGTRALGSRPAVRIEGLSKWFALRRQTVEILGHPFTFRYQQALCAISCEVMEGEFFGLLGPNGAGKTTLFKTLATLILPDLGTATVLGHDVVREAAAVRRALVPVVADERSLRWRISARENLRLYGVLYGVGRKELPGRVQQVLETVGLADTGNKMVGQFSSGMKQRLLIGRALLARPRVLLLDEPTRGLDPVSARNLRRFLRDEICLGLGCTVLLATHSAEEAFELCDRVAVLDKGRLLVAGAAHTLMQQFSEQRYHLWTDTPAHPAIEQLVSRSLAESVRAGVADQDGWTPVEVKASGGYETAARIVEFLATRQVAVARFERATMSLAELIEKVQGALGGGHA